MTYFKVKANVTQVKVKVSRRKAWRIQINSLARLVVPGLLS